MNFSIGSPSLDNQGCQRLSNSHLKSVDPPVVWYKKEGKALKAVVLFMFSKAAACGTILDDELCYMCVCLLCCFFLLFMKGEWGCLKE